MKVATILLAAMAIFGAALAKLVIDGHNVLTVPQILILEDQLMEIVNKVQEAFKKYDPLDLEDFKFEKFGYSIELTKLHAQGFSDFDVTHLEISILNIFKIDFTLPAVKGQSGPFKGGYPNGEVYSNGQNSFSMTGGYLKVEGKISLMPMRVTNLSFEIQVNQASVKLEAINDDPNYTKELNSLANEFLSKTVNDKEWQKSVTPTIQDLLNQILEEVLG